MRRFLFSPRLFLACSSATGAIFAFVFWAKRFDHESVWSDGLPYLVAALGLAALFYALLLVSPPSGAISVRQILIGTALVAMPLLALPPLTSSDVFANGYYGNLVVRYHENPFAVSPDAPVADSLFAATSAAAPFRTTYGPAWIMTAAAVVRLTGERLWLVVEAFRWLNVAAFAGLLAVLWRLLAADPARAWKVALVAWNPLILFEGLQNAHNDLIMIALVAAALLAYHRRRDWLVLPLLTVAALVKYVPALLLPLAIVAIARWRGRAAARPLLAGSAASAFLAVLAFAPFWGGSETFAALFRLGSFWSAPFFHPHAWGVWLLQHLGWGTLEARGAVQHFGSAVVVVVVAVLVWLVSRGRWSLATASIAAVSAFLLFGVSYIQPWYLLWVLPLAPLLPSVWARYVLFFGTIIPLASYAIFSTI